MGNIDHVSAKSSIFQVKESFCLFICKTYEVAGSSADILTKIRTIWFHKFRHTLFKYIP